MIAPETPLLTGIDGTYLAIAGGILSEEDFTVGNGTLRYSRQGSANDIMSFADPCR
jgi:hypothetical protein